MGNRDPFRIKMTGPLAPFAERFCSQLIRSGYTLRSAREQMYLMAHKAHFTETCEPGQPHFVVHVATTDGATSDVDTVEGRHDDLAAADLLPEQHLANTGYISAGQIVTARDKHGVELIGPLLPDTSWQAADPDAFDLTKFSIDWDAKHVVCPNGKVSRNWQHAHSRDGLPVMRATFRQPDCRPCPDRHRCTRSQHITFLPQPQTEAQRQLRAEQSTSQRWQ